MTAHRHTEADDATDLARAEAWLDDLDPDITPAEDPGGLRRIGLARHALDRARSELDDAVAAARDAGRSWGAIGMVLGVSRQGARQRFGHLERSASTP